MKNKLFIALAVLVLILLTELMLRLMFGFCDALLYNQSEEYEYIASPNQDRCRFGSKIHYNSYSQRSEEPDSTKVKVLGFGDSVLFGGTWMDQDSLATTLFTNETGMQMLNIACGSWGPDNCAAYLREKGSFGAKAMVLVCSSHDAYDTMTFDRVVGVYPNYPEKQYPLALQELICRYMIPRVSSWFKGIAHRLDPDAAVVEATGKTIARKSECFNPGFDELKSVADSLQIPFCIYLHAEQGELEQGEYNDMGKKVISWAEENDVALVRGLETETSDMYHDVIHLNEKGQRHLANCLMSIVRGGIE